MSSVVGESPAPGEQRSTVAWMIVLLTVAAAAMWYFYLRGPIDIAGVELGTVDLAPLIGEGRTVDNATLQGKVTLVNFWGTWCPPCVAEFPHLMRTYDAHKDRPEFQFVSVSVGDPDVDSLRTVTADFLKERGYQLPVYYDPDNRTRRNLKGVPSVVPITLLIGRDGKVANMAVGFDEPKLDEINLQIASLLQAAPK